MQSRLRELAFLVPCLTFWLVGEVFVLAVLGRVAITVIASTLGVALVDTQQILPDGFAPVLVLFLTIWLAMWTVAGIAGVSELLRALAGRDAIGVTWLDAGIPPRARRRIVALAFWALAAMMLFLAFVPAFVWDPNLIEYDPAKYGATPERFVTLGFALLLALRAGSETWGRSEVAERQKVT